MSEVVLGSVGVSYAGKPAVQDVDLTIPSGGRLAILGPSGCGKSSLLRAVAGLEPLAGGRVTVAGCDLAGVPTHRRGVGLMFQDHALFPHLDVAGNVAFGLRLAKWPQERARQRVSEMLELVGLSERAGSAVTSLSGGEQQRVALARTLAPEPGVVLLDEPLGSLDRVLREELVITMVEVFDTAGATVIFVTHDQSEAFALGHEVAVMRAGRIRQVGTQPELWGRPADAWVAGFLGMTNIFAAGTGPLAGEPGAPGRAGPDRGNRGQYLLRPDLLELPAVAGDIGSSTGPAVARIPVTVRSTVFRGGFWVVTVLPDRPDPAAAGMPAGIEVWVMGAAPRVGDRLLLHVPPASIIDLPPGCCG